MTLLEQKIKEETNGMTNLAAFIGKSYPSAVKYVTGETQPTLDVAKKIEEYTGIPMSDFYTVVKEQGRKATAETPVAQ